MEHVFAAGMHLESRLALYMEASIEPQIRMTNCMALNFSKSLLSSCAFMLCHMTSLLGKKIIIDIQGLARHLPTKKKETCQTIRPNQHCTYICPATPSYTKPRYITIIHYLYKVWRCFIYSLYILPTHIYIQKVTPFKEIT